MLKQYLNNTKTLTLSFLRNKETIFFVLLLPLIFMLIFGSLYSGGDQSQPDRVLIYYSDQATIEQSRLEEVINENQSLTFKYVSTLEAGEELLRNYKAEALLTVWNLPLILPEFRIIRLWSSRHIQLPEKSI
ncbi:ABC-2 family transporter [Halanaerobium saccharolyticum]|uniref:ABC-2 family transporter n=1 Tax=Halanaerobium saccharolyticum TaxID=43595 RepID=A0A4R6LPK8_9FIRM|nr:ABC transporter permease [Halanaerobium saccharolyticum]TDO89329.1 ABC-2 family transporter [Halanaerobium saccharolyticum]